MLLDTASRSTRIEKRPDGVKPFGRVGAQDITIFTVVRLPPLAEEDFFDVLPNAEFLTFDNIVASS